MQQRKTLLAAGLLFSLTTINAQAQLTVTANGLGVYDSSLDATWTQDANLLGTLEASDANLVSKIINASGGVIHDTPNPYNPTGNFTLTAADFSAGGSVDWYAAQAFMHYLDTINYGGSSQWALPTQPDQSRGDNITNSQLGELFYNELGGVAGVNIITTHNVNYNLFSNVQPPYPFWTSREYTSSESNAWTFYTSNGHQDADDKQSHKYAWAVSPGQLAAVPVPGAVWLFGTGILGLLGLKRRKVM